MKVIVMILYILLVGFSYSEDIDLLGGRYKIHTEFDNVWICDNPIFDNGLVVRRSLMRKMDEDHKLFFVSGLKGGSVDMIEAPRSIIRGETWFFFEKEGEFINFSFRSRLEHVSLMKDAVCFDVYLGDGDKDGFSIREGIMINVFNKKDGVLSVRERVFWFRGFSWDEFRKLPFATPPQAPPDYISL